MKRQESFILNTSSSEACSSKYEAWKIGRILCKWGPIPNKQLFSLPPQPARVNEIGTGQWGPAASTGPTNGSQAGCKQGRFLSTQTSRYRDCPTKSRPVSHARATWAKSGSNCQPRQQRAMRTHQLHSAESAALRHACAMKVGRRAGIHEVICPIATKIEAGGHNY